MTVQKLAQGRLISDFPCVIVHKYLRNAPVKDIRVRVETNDGCSTVWYEKSKLKEPTGPICDRVTKQLMGLNIKRIEVDLVPAM